MKNSIKYLTAAAVALGLNGVAFATPALELLSGASANTVTIQDNGAGDLNSASGAIAWLGTINGWTVTITSGATKPIQGSTVSPNMDLDVQATGGSGLLTVMFTDTDFGPTSGLIFNPGSNVGTSTATAAAYYSTGNGQFVTTGGTIPTSLLLANPYSITIVDTFTAPGTVSLDDRVTAAPDGGSTVMLLGAALSTVGLLRKKLTT